MKYSYEFINNGDGINTDPNMERLEKLFDKLQWMPPPKGECISISEIPGIYTVTWIVFNLVENEKPDYKSRITIYLDYEI